MTISILIPTPLRRFVNGADSVSVQASNVHEAIVNLTEKYGDLRKQLLNDKGEIRSFVNIFLNETNVRDISTDQQKVSLKDGDTLMIIPAIAGGVDGDLSRSEISRYSRHLIMPEVTLAGQKKLKNAKVLCIGAGGLGSPLTLYLAAAGVGTLGVVEFDQVDLSNIQRQILYSTSDVGRPKLEAAKERLSQLNPDIRIVPHSLHLASHNAVDLFSEYDIIADGTDNFPTRYLVNDACVLTGKTNVYASIFRFEGQVSVFGEKTGPCYRCMFPEPPPPGLVPSCAEGGVLGVLPGIVGSLQALEVLKLILGIGKPLVGRMVLFDALNHKSREISVKKRTDCAICGTSPTIKAPIDYVEFCGIRGEEVEVNMTGFPTISVEVFDRRRKAGETFELIDVRESHEFEIVSIPGAKLMPLSELAGRLHELDSTRSYTISCHRGERSVEAFHLLKKAGYGQLQILDGGVSEWARKIDPSLPTY